MRPCIRFAAVLAIVLAGAGLVVADEPILGKLGAVLLKSADVKRLVEGQSPEFRAQLANSQPDLDQFVRNELVRRAVLAEALAKGVDKRPEVLQAMERAKEQAIVTAYANQLSRPPAEFPAQMDIDHAYAASVQSFTVPAQYHLAQIFVKLPEGADKARLEAAQKKADDIVAKLKVPNTDFAAVAKSSSEHTQSAASGGDLGWLTEGQVLPEVRPTLALLKPGQYSNPIKTSQGWHVIKLLERKDVQVLPLAEVRDRIVAALRYRKAQENEQKYLSDLTTKTPITIDEPELKKLQAALK